MQKRGIAPNRGVMGVERSVSEAQTRRSRCHTRDVTSVAFEDARRKLSATLLSVSDALPPGQISLRALLELIGEQGMLLGCVFLTLPFLLPVSIPGVSTVFGLAVILIGVAVTLNRVPWLPRRMLDQPLSTAPLRQAFEKGARFVGRFERLVRPRWLFLTQGPTANAVHGLALVAAGVLLSFPLGLVPFSNTLPAVAALFLALGMLERDGVLILAGYLMNLATIAYFGALALGAILAGQSLLDLLGG